MFAFEKRKNFRENFYRAYTRVEGYYLTFTLRAVWAPLGTLDIILLEAQINMT